MELLNCNTRNKKSAHQAKKTRRDGKVPGNIYGKDRVNLLFEIGELELDKEICKNGEHGLLNINVDGSVHNTLIKEVQRDPVNHKIIHIDLEEMSKDKRVVTDVPLIFSGEEMQAREGRILQKEKSSVKVQCKAEDIPKGINVDLSKLRTGDTYRIMDIEVSSEISFVEDLNSVIVAVTHDNINVSDDETNPTISEE